MVLDIIRPFDGANDCFRLPSHRLNRFNRFLKSKLNLVLSLLMYNSSRLQIETHGLDQAPNPVANPASPRRQQYSHYSPGLNSSENIAERDHQLFVCYSLWIL